ncbi:MAG: M64 family metallo-endopeptidase, partial [Chloroflexota bacterium]|nr:M64 family metallo-endopeptidase [Chloroflexota bacterium]
MGVGDGTILGTTKIVDHGSATSRWNMVILGDGYQASEINQYHADVQNFVNTLYNTAPFNRVWCGINIHRVDVTSTDSGADDPATCGDGSGGSGVTARTYFDASFCNSGIRRLLEVDSASARSVALAQVPQMNMTMVIVNTTEYGGSGGSVAAFSLAPNAAEIGIHEMGHTAFGFADEYEYYAGCGSGETGHDHYTGGEPTQPNVTINTNRATNKWRSLILPATAMPTTQNANCSQCDTQANPVSAATVGTFEGANYNHCGCYRPQYTCRMRALSNPFCAVCQQVIVQTLTPYVVPTTVNLTTPSIAFANIPEGIGGTGVTTFRAVVFEVTSCSPITLHITALTSTPTGSFSTPLGTSITVPPGEFTSVTDARLWISYTSTTAGSSSVGSVTVHCDETGQTWVIPIVANTVARPKAAVSFVFDHSGSMIEDAGDGTTKVQKLREAANIFVNVMLPGDGIGIVRFDDTSQILMPITDVGPAVIGGGRTTAQGIINSAQLDPAGSTSIGAGVINGKQALDTAQALGTPHYDVTAMVVLTDGEENTAPFLSAVGSSITANTFAVGLGIPANISTAALATLTQGHNGYLLITGSLTPDQSSRLAKYFLQILAGITNANVILDPQGYLVYGAEQRIPFTVTEADMGLDVILLSPAPYAIDFELETPDGSRLTPASAGATVQFVSASDVSYYRLSLPALPPDPSGSHEGTWNAILSLGRKERNPQSFAMLAQAQATRALPYNLVVHSYSNLDFRATLQQTGFEPGATVTVVGRLTEYDFPLEGRATVRAEITRPDGSG